MNNKRITLVLASVAAAFGIAAAPTHAQETNTAAVGAIDMSKVAAPGRGGDDAQFQ